MHLYLTEYQDILLLESGVRFHTTTFNHDKSETPNVFSRKLRAAVRHKRLEGIRQLGSDRVVDFKFGSGDAVAHILLELYSSGNIVLTDGSYEIVAALRTHEFEEGVNIKVGEVYPVTYATTLGEHDGGSNLLGMSPSEFLQWASATEQHYAENQARNAASKKGGKIKKMILRHLLLSKDSGLHGIGPEIIDHCVQLAGLKPTSKAIDFISGHIDGVPPEDETSQRTAREALVGRVLEELRKGVKLLDLFDAPSNQGYILMRPSGINKSSITAPEAMKVEGINSTDEGETKEEEEYEYVEFIPYLFHQHTSNPYVKQFPSFATAVDDYFCKVLFRCLSF